MSASPAEPTAPTPAEVVIIGAGPAGLTAAYELVKRGITPVGARGRLRRRRHQPHGAGRRLALRHRRPPLLHQGAGGRGALARDPAATRTSCCGPGMSRIYYEGKFYDYPLKPFNALAQPRAGRGDPLRAVLRAGSGSVRRRTRRRSRAGHRRRFGWRLYKHFFKTYNEKLWGVPARRAPGRLRARSASRTCRCSTRSWEPRWPSSSAAQPGRRSPRLIEEFQYPKYGPGMMWERCRELVEAAGAKVVMEHRGHRPSDHHDGRATRRRDADADGRRPAPTTRPTTSSRRCRSLACSRPWTRRRPPRCRGRGRRRCASATSSRWPLVVPEERGFPDNWIYVHSPEVAGRPHPELRLVVAVPGQGRPHLPRPRVLRVRGRRDLEPARRRAHRAGQARARASSAWSTRPRSKPATSCGCRRRIPFYDADYKANVDVHARLARRQRAQRAPGRAATACTGTTTRTTRCTRPCSPSRTSSRRAPRHLDGQRRGGVPRDAVGVGVGPGARVRHRPRRARDPSRRLPSRPSPGRLHPPVTEPMLSGGPGEMAEMARAAGLRRVHVLAWRDLADVEAGGSEVHCAEVVRRWAEAGLEVTMRTSYAQGHPPEAVRDGYRVIRKHGRFMVFPTTVISEVLGRTGPTDGLVEYWNGTPYLSPLWARGRRTSPWSTTSTRTCGGWCSTRRWRRGASGSSGGWHRRSTGGRHWSPCRSRRGAELIDYLHFSPDQITVVPPGIDLASRPAGRAARLPLVVSVGRLMAPKRFDELIRVMAEVREQHPTVQLVIVGDGYERLALEATDLGPRRRPTGSAWPVTCPTTSCSPCTARPGWSPARRSPRAGA